MTVTELQALIGAVPDGQWGPKSRAALVARFTNPKPSGITTDQMQRFADRLGCSLRQLAAVAAVESSGTGFDATGKPRILFERHIFNRLTGGRWSPCSFSDASYGGYSEPSWNKLADACGANPDAAFSSCSWGRFQVMGMHWRRLAYDSAFALAASTVADEAAHFELLARFIETMGLKQPLRQISARREDCEEFAQAYNGADYRRNSYHIKLARAMG